VAHQRPAAGLAPGIGAKVRIQRRQLGFVRVDQGERDRDLLARCWRQLKRREPGACLGAEQPGARRGTVVIERRLDALLPLATLVDERVAQPDPGTQLEPSTRSTASW
jgi:hypothetical protein